MPGWLNKLTNYANTVSDNADDWFENVEEALCNVDLTPTCTKIKETSMEVRQLASETIELCDSTRDTGTRMVEFGNDIAATLQDFTNVVDADTLETIQDLTDGDKLLQAQALATDMKGIAMQCVEKSTQMIDLLDDCMEQVPDVVQRAIDRAAKEDEPMTRDLENGLNGGNIESDLADVQECIQAIQDLRLVTAMKVGLRAYQQLGLKFQKTMDMFEAVSGFSRDITTLSDSLLDFDIKTVVQKAKDLWRCLRLTSTIRQVAEWAGQLITVLVDLFGASSDRISVLWAALAFCKECMSDCLVHVKEATTLCVDARDKSALLIDKTKHILDEFESIGCLDQDSIGSIRSIAEGSQIRDSIELASQMDDIVFACCEQVIQMIQRVWQAVENLPDIITEGIDAETDGKDEADEQPRNVDLDIHELDTVKQELENANIIEAVSVGARSIKGARDKVEVCRSMLDTVQSFSGNCDASIADFLEQVWDLDDAMVKIADMMRLFQLGNLMKEFANQIKRLLQAIIAIMKAAIEKLTLDMDEVKDFLGDKISDLAEKIKFW